MWRTYKRLFQTWLSFSVLLICGELNYGQLIRPLLTENFVFSFFSSISSQIETFEKICEIGPNKFFFEKDCSEDWISSAILFDIF